MIILLQKRMAITVFICCVLLSSCTASKSEPLQTGDRGTLGDFSITVLSYEMVDQVQTNELLGYQPTHEDLTYLKVRMTVRNNGTDQLPLLPLEYHTQKDLMLAVVVEGGEEPQTFDAINLMGYQEGLADKVLAPQEEITGHVIFEVQKSLETSALKIQLRAQLGNEYISFVLREGEAQTPSA